MKIEYDPKHDIMNIVFIDEKIVESNEVDGIIIDYTDDKRIASIEILDVARRMKIDPMESMNIVIMKDIVEEIAG
ncbi:MAG: DUF2283 domain-containing protein [Euryarchaeota archaeon]|nr:DUF2283 domain-containing protein [Euryarchaeota archaeon]MCG2734873.1 DUF2283 domain-containing protein [Candidatus Methanoperedenaceae archaeon]